LPVAHVQTEAGLGWRRVARRRTREQVLGDGVVAAAGRAQRDAEIRDAGTRAVERPFPAREVHVEPGERLDGAEPERVARNERRALGPRDAHAEVLGAEQGCELPFGLAPKHHDFDAIGRRQGLAEQQPQRDAVDRDLHRALEGEADLVAKTAEAAEGEGEIAQREARREHTRQIGEHHRQRRQRIGEPAMGGGGEQAAAIDGGCQRGTAVPERVATPRVLEHERDQGQQHIEPQRDGEALGIGWRELRRRKQSERERLVAESVARVMQRQQAQRRDQVAGRGRDTDLDSRRDAHADGMSELDEGQHAGGSADRRVEAEGDGDIVGRGDD
jgi:hypothetical protein